MKLGPLDKRCRIEQKITAQDQVYGTQVVTWALVGVAWCNVQDELPSKSEAVKNGLAQSVQRARVRMRYRSDIDSSMRIVINRPDETVYQIVGGPAEFGQKDGIELFVEVVR